MADAAVGDARGGGRRFALWFALLAGPVAWAIGLNAAYSLVLVACVRGTTLPLHLVSLSTLLLAGSGGVMGWREWQRVGRSVPSDAPGPGARTRFLAALAAAGSAYFALAILAQWIGIFLLHPCMGR